MYIGRAYRNRLVRKKGIEDINPPLLPILCFLISGVLFPTEPFLKKLAKDPFI